MNLNIYNKIGNQFNLGVGYTTNHLNFKPVMVKTNDAIFFNNQKIIYTYKFDFNEKLPTTFTEEENPNYDILASIFGCKINKIFMQEVIKKYKIF